MGIHCGVSTITEPKLPYATVKLVHLVVLENMLEDTVLSVSAMTVILLFVLSEGGQHRYKSLAKLQQTIRASYQSSIEKISELHTKFTKTSKASLYRFNELVVSYDENGKLNTVDAIMEQQVGALLSMTMITIMTSPYWSDSQYSHIGEIRFQRNAYKGVLLDRTYLKKCWGV